MQIRSVHGRRKALAALLQLRELCVPRWSKVYVVSVDEGNAASAWKEDSNPKSITRSQKLNVEPLPEAKHWALRSGNYDAFVRTCKPQAQTRLFTSSTLACERSAHTTQAGYSFYLSGLLPTAVILNHLSSQTS